MIEVKSAKKANLSLVERKRLHDILRVAYAETEIEVWGENYERINFDDYNELIEKDEILVALHEGEVVGGVHYYEREAGMYAFSLLCADFEKSGLGIGRHLIQKVEEIATNKKASEIQIEILRPKGIEVEFKKRISSWYQRLGYNYTHSRNFAEILPERAVNLVNPSDFDFYQKVLA